MALDLHDARNRRLDPSKDIGCLDAHPYFWGTSLVQMVLDLFYGLANCCRSGQPHCLLDPSLTYSGGMGPKGHRNTQDVASVPKYHYKHIAG